MNHLLSVVSTNTKDVHGSVGTVFVHIFVLFHVRGRFSYLANNFLVTAAASNFRRNLKNRLEVRSENQRWKAESGKFEKHQASRLTTPKVQMVASLGLFSMSIQHLACSLVSFKLAEMEKLRLSSDISFVPL